MNMSEEIVTIAERMILYPVNVTYNPAGAAEVWMMAQRMAKFIIESQKDKAMTTDEATKLLDSLEGPDHHPDLLGWRERDIGRIAAALVAARAGGRQEIAEWLEREAPEYKEEGAVLITQLSAQIRAGIGGDVRSIEDRISEARAGGIREAAQVARRCQREREGQANSQPALTPMQSEAHMLIRAKGSEAQRIAAALESLLPAPEPVEERK